MSVVALASASDILASMEPRIQYARTSDGVNIAYTVTGSGPPHLVCSEPLGSHQQLAWSHPVIGRFFVEYARRNTLVTFDPRGTGLSQRVHGQTLDDYVLDIEAVVKRVGLEEFGMSAIQLATPATIAFAARHPANVSRLVLAEGFTRFRECLRTSSAQALLTAARADFVVATEAIGFVVHGAGREESRDHGAYIRACIGPDMIAQIEVAEPWDVSEPASAITAPTLVLKHDGLQFTTMEMAKDLAARIPNAQLTVIQGTWADDPDGVARRISAFINADVAHAAAPAEGPSGTAIILFADIVDSTALTERLGDAAFRDKARELDTALRAIASDHGGSAVEGKLVGDGVMAVFMSARQAIEAALACGEAGRHMGLPLHLGIHAGDVIREEGNVYGGAVNIASRIAGLSAPGEVLVSDTVRGLARTSAGVAFEDRGEQGLKGVGDPVRVWAVTPFGGQALA